VEELGPEAKGFEVGDRIFGQSDIFDHLDTSGLQQYALLEADVSAKIPGNISDDEAATFPVNVITALVTLFDKDGFGFPIPSGWITGGQELSNTQLVIIGGGSNTGKFTIQLAALAGIGDIIVVAGKSNEKELRSYGATHVIDRHLSNEEIKNQVDAITKSNCLYVCETVTRDHTFAVSLLSSTQRGKVVGLLPGETDESKIGEKKAGYDKSRILASSHLKRELCAPFWKVLPSLIETGKVKSLGYKVVEGGLNAAGVNDVLNALRDGTNLRKGVVHPADEPVEV